MNYLTSVRSCRLRRGFQKQTCMRSDRLRVILRKVADEKEKSIKNRPRVPDRRLESGAISRVLESHPRPTASTR